MLLILQTIILIYELIQWMIFHKYILFKILVLDVPNKLKVNIYMSGPVHIEFRDT